MILVSVIYKESSADIPRLNTLPEFAAGLLGASGNALFAKPHASGDYIVAHDPLTGGNVNIFTGDLEKMLRRLDQKL